MKKLICKIIGIYYSIVYMAPIDGCDYKESKIKINKKTGRIEQKLICSRCGNVDIAWYK